MQLAISFSSCTEPNAAEEQAFVRQSRSAERLSKHSSSLERRPNSWHSTLAGNILTHLLPVLSAAAWPVSKQANGNPARPCHCAAAGNILTHLLPALALAAAVMSGWLRVWPGYAANFFGNVGPILVCLVGSVVYHTFMAHHQKYRTWLALDVSF